MHFSDDRLLQFTVPTELQNQQAAQQRLTAAAPAATNATQPIRQTNPWQPPAAFQASASPAENWLQSTATVLSSGSQAQTAAAPVVAAAQPVAPSPPQHTVSVHALTAATHNNAPTFAPAASSIGTPPPVAPRQAPVPVQRSQTVDNSQVQWYHQKAPTLKELQQSNQMNFLSQEAQQHNGSVSSPTTGQSVQAASPWAAQPLGPTTSDPFDAAWATKSPNVKPPSSNPFQSGDTVTQTFKVQL